MPRMNNEEITQALLELIDESQEVKAKASQITSIATQILSEIAERRSDE